MTKIAYTPEEAADILSISERTLHTLRQRGDFPYPVKIGSRLKYTHKALEDWVNTLPRVVQIDEEPPQLAGTDKTKKSVKAETGWRD